MKKEDNQRLREDLLDVIIWRIVRDIKSTDLQTNAEAAMALRSVLRRLDTRRLDGVYEKLEGERFTLGYDETGTFESHCRRVGLGMSKLDPARGQAMLIVFRAVFSGLRKPAGSRDRYWAECTLARIIRRITSNRLEVIVKSLPL